MEGGGYAGPTGPDGARSGHLPRRAPQLELSESWLAVKPGTEDLAGASKFFFEKFSTFSDFHRAAAVMLDVDGSTDAAEIPRFVAALCYGADFVEGSPFTQGGGSSDITLPRRLVNRALNGHRRGFFRLRAGTAAVLAAMVPRAALAQVCDATAARYDSRDGHIEAAARDGAVGGDSDGHGLGRLPFTGLNLLITGIAGAGLVGSAIALSGISGPEEPGVRRRYG